MIIEQYIAQLYEEGKSPYEIAEILGGSMNHMKIRRCLRKIGIVIRDKGAAQKAALASGRAKSPKKKLTKEPEGSYNTVDQEHKPAESQDEFNEQNPRSRNV